MRNYILKKERKRSKKREKKDWKIKKQNVQNRNKSIKIRTLKENKNKKGF